MIEQPEPRDPPAEPAAAEREWSTRARVRIVKPYAAGSVDPWETRRFAPGEELEMVQHGREGRPADRSCWWTSADIDGAFIVPADRVEVLEVLKESPPAFADAALPPEKVAALFGPASEGWAAQGILVVPATYDLEIRAASGELLGLVARGGTGEQYAEVITETPVTYRAVLRTRTDDGHLLSRESWPSVRMPGGFVPPHPARCTAGERARWGGTGTGTADGITVRVTDGGPQ